MTYDQSLKYERRVPVNLEQVLQRPAIPPPVQRASPLAPTEGETYQQDLLARVQQGDPRLRVKRPKELISDVQVNDLYGTTRSKGEWRYLIDNYAKGTITTIAGQTVSVAIALAVPPHFFLSRWPGAIALYFCIRQFSISPQTATFATAGALDIVFQDQAGNIIPLGDTLNSSIVNMGLVSLIPTAITDPDNQSIGNLQVALTAAATTGTYNYQLAFSAAYLLPSLKGYSYETKGGDAHEPLDTQLVY